MRQKVKQRQFAAFLRRKADGIAYIKEAKADAAVLQIKSMEAFEKAS